MIFLLQYTLDDNLVDWVLCIASQIDCLQDSCSFLARAYYIRHVSLLRMFALCIVIRVYNALKLYFESRLLHLILLGSLQLIIVKEVDQVSLTGLQRHFTGELVDA